MTTLKTIYGTYNITHLPNFVKAIAQNSTHEVNIEISNKTYNTGVKQITKAIETDYENTILNQTPC